MNAKEPRWCKCIYCGKDFETVRHGVKFCSSTCRKSHANDVSRQLNAERRKERDKNPYVCKRVKSCRYGLPLGGGGDNPPSYCGFLEIEGHSRGCWAIDCTYYVPKKKGASNEDCNR